MIDGLGSLPRGMRRDEHPGERRAAIQTRSWRQARIAIARPLLRPPRDAVVDDDVRRPVPALPLAMPAVPPISCRDDKKPSPGAGGGDGFSYSVQKDGPMMLGDD